MGWKWSDVRVPVGCPSPRRGHEASPGRKGLRLGEGSVFQGEGVHLGEEVFA